MRNTPIQPRADRKICTCAVPTLRSCTDDEICGAHPEARPAGLPPLTTFNSVKLHLTLVAESDGAGLTYIGGSPGRQWQR